MVTLYKPVVGGKVGRTASVQFGSEVKNMQIYAVRVSSDLWVGKVTLF